MRLCDVGAAIQEVMESYEVEINGKVYQGMMLAGMFVFVFCFVTSIWLIYFSIHFPYIEF